MTSERRTPSREVGQKEDRFSPVLHRMVAENKMDRGGKRVKGLPEERVIQLAQYIIEQDATVRQAAGRFAISKSTVHKDISQRLEKLSPSLHQQVRQVLERNKQERHIRGGMATKEKYEQLRKANAEK